MVLSWGRSSFCLISPCLRCCADRTWLPPERIAIQAGQTRQRISAHVWLHAGKRIPLFLLRLSVGSGLKGAFPDAGFPLAAKNKSKLGCETLTEVVEKYCSDMVVIRTAPGGHKEIVPSQAGAITLHERQLPTHAADVGADPEVVRDVRLCLSALMKVRPVGFQETFDLIGAAAAAAAFRA